MCMKRIYTLVAVLCLAAFLTSVFMQAQSDTTVICPVGGCHSVQSSVYGRILGIQNIMYGMLGFGVLFLLAAMQRIERNTLRDAVLIAGCTLAGLMALWFISVQVFILHEYCAFCLLVDGISIILLVLGVLLFSRR